MPRSPNGSRPTNASAVKTTLAAGDFAFLLGLEAAIDGALDGHRPGESFVYGIHQEMPAGVAEALEARYRAAGWSEARVKPGETGAHVVVLVP